MNKRAIFSACLLVILSCGQCSLTRHAGPPPQTVQPSDPPPPKVDPVPTTEAIPVVEKSKVTSPSGDRVDFERDVLPILEACRPCHFEGGQKYADLPFDDPETILALGEKLFTRINKEEERTVIRSFLAQSSRADEP